MRAERLTQKGGDNRGSLRSLYGRNSTGAGLGAIATATPLTLTDASLASCAAAEGNVSARSELSDAHGGGSASSEGRESGASSGGNARAGYGLRGGLGGKMVAAAAGRAEKLAAKAKSVDMSRTKNAYHSVQVSTD